MRWQKEVALTYFEEALPMEGIYETCQGNWNRILPQDLPVPVDYEDDSLLEYLFLLVVYLTTIFSVAQTTKRQVKGIQADI